MCRCFQGGITVDTEEVLVVPDNTFMPDVNDVLSVYITHFKTPSLLFGQIKHPSNRYGNYDTFVFILFFYFHL